MNRARTSSPKYCGPPEPVDFLAHSWLGKKVRKHTHHTSTLTLVHQTGVDKRADVFATALRAKLTIDDLVHSELAYAPPFGAAKGGVDCAQLNADVDG